MADNSDIPILLFGNTVYFIAMAMLNENHNVLNITILKYLLHVSQHVSRSFKLVNLFL